MRCPPEWLARWRARCTAARACLSPEQLKTTKLELSNKTSELNSVETELHSTRKQLGDELLAEKSKNSLLSEQCTRLDGQNQELLQLVESLRAQLANKEAELQRAQRELRKIEQAAHTSIGQLMAVGQDLDSAHSKHSQELAGLQAALERKSNELVAAKAEIQRLHDELATARTQISALRCGR